MHWGLRANDLNLIASWFTSARNLHMKILSPKAHGILDYAVVIIFCSAPTLFGLSGLPAMIAYALAVVHLVLTLGTAFPLGIVKLVPLPVHGAIEFVVSLALVALPWLLKFNTEIGARNFYLGAGVSIFLVWLITDYRAVNRGT
jgi:hypothetical protein